MDFHDGVEGVVPHALLFLRDGGGFGVVMGMEGGEDEAAKEVVRERGAAERHGFREVLRRSRRSREKRD